MEFIHTLNVFAGLPSDFTKTQKIKIECNYRLTYIAFKLFKANSGNSNVL